MSDGRAGPLVVDPTQVDMLVAVVDDGLFDTAAHRLGRNAPQQLCPDERVRDGPGMTATE